MSAVNPTAPWDSAHFGAGRLRPGPQILGVDVLNYAHFYFRLSACTNLV